MNPIKIQNNKIIINPKYIENSFVKTKGYKEDIENQINKLTIKERANLLIRYFPKTCGRIAEFIIKGL